MLGIDARWKPPNIWKLDSAFLERTHIKDISGKKQTSLKTETKLLMMKLQQQRYGSKNREASGEDKTFDRRGQCGGQDLRQGPERLLEEPGEDSHQGEENTPRRNQESRLGNWVREMTQQVESLPPQACRPDSGPQHHIIPALWRQSQGLPGWRLAVTGEPHVLQWQSLL